MTPFRQARAVLHEVQAVAALPADFDRKLYLKLHPDVRHAAFDPAEHFLLHGRQEGRIYALPVIDVCGDHEFQAGRETVLVVSHEASRTGAPVLSLNLVQGLVGKYNVVALLLGGGALADAFRRAGAGVTISPNLRGNATLAEHFIVQLCGRYTFKFALVNSIESRVVLPGLSECFVPAISLVHEFASYTRPRDAFRDALFWSGEVVFSAKVTMENAFAEYPDLGKRAAHILPQGQCLLPDGEFSAERQQRESARIRRLVRPQSAQDAVVILGAGFVQLRKGVDLFIECAARVARAPGGDKCRFVWIGKGYDPDNDVGYSVYLADQIRRTGLQQHVFFIDETSSIETAYDEADLFLLSSRLDPLPNVAIDAMALGVPVLCFDKTTGIADFLVDSGLGADCVAGYLDSAAMAENILALANAPAERARVSAQCRAASHAYFDMRQYLARIEELAASVAARTQQECADTRLILESGLFRPDFSNPPQRQGQALEADVRAYVRAWASGIGRRKPFPGFHPGVYQERHGLASDCADPFADYLRAGQPAGPWTCPVILPGPCGQGELPPQRRVALHLHVYYVDLLPEILTRLGRNASCPDLFISIADEAARPALDAHLRAYPGVLVDVQLVPNRGRDIGPFLTAFGPRLLADYDFVGHLHTKKSVDVKDAAMGKAWYAFLLDNLLGSAAGAAADGILARMHADPAIGLVFPDDPYVVGLGANHDFAAALAARIGLPGIPEHFCFPVGTMFWARTAALAPLLELRLQWDDYPEEPLPYDGSMLHALERLFALSLSLGKTGFAVTNIAGVTR